MGAPATTTIHRAPRPDARASGGNAGTPPVPVRPRLRGSMRAASKGHYYSQHAVALRADLARAIPRDLLRALHHVESNAAPDGCVTNLEDSGAVGPFQFKPATFGQYGVDANFDGERDICSFSDALFSAARYLRAIGADADPSSEGSRRALARYGTDVERVVSLARAYRERDRY